MYYVLSMHQKFVQKLRFTCRPHLIIPEPTARSAVPGVSPGRGLLIPHGYSHPGEKTALADSKWVSYVIVGWVVISLISKIWMFIRSGRGKNYKKHVRKLKDAVKSVLRILSAHNKVCFRDPHIGIKLN